MMKPIDSTITTNGSTFNPGDSSVYSPVASSQPHLRSNMFSALIYIAGGVVRRGVLNIVLLLPPAPAARVLAGLAFATFASRSAAAFLLIAVAGPPGGLGDAGRAVVEPVDGAELTGDVGRGEDWYFKLATEFAVLDYCLISSGGIAENAMTAMTANKAVCQFHSQV